MGNLKHTLRGHTDNIHGLVVSSDGQTIVSGSRDRSIKTWNIATGALEQSLKNDRSDIIVLTLSIVLLRVSENR